MIDSIFALFMILALIKGYKKGLIMAVFSTIALIMGLLLAMSLSGVTAKYLQGNTNIMVKWLPAISFAITFFIAVMLVRWSGSFIEKIFKTVMLGWVNKIGGILLYMALYTILLSMFVYYAEKLSIIKASSLQSSATYPYLQKESSIIINNIGAVIPVFKSTFNYLETFFGGLSNKI